ncbi:hypothetical protein D3C81_1774440 [compost metagenome]
MLVFTEPIPQYCFRFVCSRYTALRADSSIGSPSFVPVPCASTYEMLSGSIPVVSSTLRITSAWPLTLGA